MEYKKIEQEGIVVGIATNEKGLPIMVDDEGVETGIDAIHLLGKVPALQEEAKGHRLKAKEIQDEFDVFKERFTGIEDPAKAIEALTRVQDIEGQNLIDANDAETLRKQLQDAHDEQFAGVKKTYDAKITELNDVIGVQQGDIFEALVLQKFNNSAWFSGEAPKTYLFPEVAKDHFGRHFKVEKNSNGKSAVVGYNIGGENDGQKIFSIERPGELAGFDEAIGIIIGKHPQRSVLMRASFGGGASGSENTGGLPKLEKMRRELVEAKKSKDTILANRLIRQIAEEEQKK